MAAEPVEACLGLEASEKLGVGRQAPSFSSMTKDSISHTLKGLERQIDDHVAEGHDAAQMLGGLVKSFKKRYPELAEAFPDGSGPVCRCRQLLPALNNLRSQPHIHSNKKVRVSLDLALMEGGVASTRDARACGVNVSNRRWAEAQGDVQVKPLGRPSKVHDMKMVYAAGEVMTASSHETVDVVIVWSPVSNSFDYVYDCVRECSRYTMFMASALLISLMSFKTFQRIRKQYYGFMRKGQRKTDVFDHCALSEFQVLPGLWHEVRRCREPSEHLWPKYFSDLDVRKTCSEQKTTFLQSTVTCGWRKLVGPSMCIEQSCLSRSWTTFIG